MAQARRLGWLLVAAIVLAAACASDDTTSAPDGENDALAGDAPAFEILVTNDDGVMAEGIDALVEALQGLDNVAVTVVAPAENQSGSSDKTTEGEVSAADSTTLSGYPATAVDGKPADAVIHALEVLKLMPDLVISGINDGQNIGPFSEASGTVGAARTAARRGFPAVAVSQGLGEPPDFPSAVAILLDWLREHRDALPAPPVVTSINVPTCPAGSLQGQVETVVAAQTQGRDMFAVDCEISVTDTMFTDDVEAFGFGYASITDVGLGD